MADIYIRIKKAKVARTISLGNVMLDKDEDENIVGVEVLGAKEVTIDGNKVEQVTSNVPMGVSQWREYGKKYGYWEFFLKKLKGEEL